MSNAERRDEVPDQRVADKPSGRPLTFREHLGVLLPDGGEAIRVYYTGSREPIDIQVLRGIKKIGNVISNKLKGNWRGFGQKEFIRYEEYLQRMNKVKKIARAEKQAKLAASQ